MIELIVLKTLTFIFSFQRLPAEYDDTGFSSLLYFSPAAPIYDEIEITSNVWHLRLEIARSGKYRIDKIENSFMVNRGKPRIW